MFSLTHLPEDLFLGGIKFRFHRNWKVNRLQLIPQTFFDKMEESNWKIEAKKRRIEDNVNVSHSENTSSKEATQNEKLDSTFYDAPCETLAKSLLGKILVRKLCCGTLLKGKIVETECYPGGEDKASHSFNGRRTEGNKPMYMKAGTAYVYFTYGMYYCFNISSQEPGGAVLLRAVEPLHGIELMQTHRKTAKRKKELKVHELCNGPAKLCISFNIDKAKCNELDLSENEHLWIEKVAEEQDKQIVISTRIGIDSAGPEWANKPLRFYVLGNTSVSKRDKIVEQMILDRS